MRLFFHRLHGVVSAPLQPRFPLVRCLLILPQRLQWKWMKLSFGVVLLPRRGLLGPLRKGQSVMLIFGFPS